MNEEIWKEMLTYMQDGWQIRFSYKFVAVAIMASYYSRKTEKLWAVEQLAISPEYLWQAWDSVKVCIAKAIANGELKQ